VLDKPLQVRAVLNENHFRELVEALPLLVWTAAPDGRCDYVSPQWVAHTGLPAEKQVGWGWQKLVHPEDLEALRAGWRCALENEEIFDGEFRIRGADGFYRWFKSRATPQRDGHSKIVKWFGTNIEIDRQKWQEEALRVRLEADARVKKLPTPCPAWFFRFAAPRMARRVCPTPVRSSKSIFRYCPAMISLKMPRRFSKPCTPMTCRESTKLLKFRRAHCGRR